MAVFLLSFSFWIANWFLFRLLLLLPPPPLFVSWMWTLSEAVMTQFRSVLGLLCVKCTLCIVYFISVGINRWFFFFSLPENPKIENYFLFFFLDFFRTQQQHLVQKKLQFLDRLCFAFPFLDIFTLLWCNLNQIAQIIGKPDLAPAAWVRRLVTLCDRAPATPFDAIQPMLEKELGRSVGEVFERFDVEPLGSASIAQVLIHV